MFTSLASFCTTFLSHTELQPYWPLKNPYCLLFLMPSMYYLRAFVPSFSSLILPKRVSGLTYSRNSGLWLKSQLSEESYLTALDKSCTTPTLPVILKSSLSHFPVLCGTYCDICWGWKGGENALMNWTESLGIGKGPS